MQPHKIFLFLISLCLFSINILYSSPLVTDVSPFFGPAAGGTPVSITGTGFTGTTVVNFGTTPAASFTVNSDSSITALSPAHSPQVVFITVTTPSGTSSETDDSRYMYQGDWQAYVANFGNASVSIIDTATDDLSITVTVGDEPSPFGITPDGTKVFVGNSSANTVSVIDPATNTVTNTITVQNHPSGIAIALDGTKAYVANTGSDTVSVLDIDTETVVGTPITVGDSPISIAITPDGKQVYVADSGENTVSVIDTATLAVTSITVSLRPYALDITPDGMQVYATNVFTNDVSVINTTSNTEIKVISVQGNPVEIAMTPDGTKAYVVNEGSSSVSVIDTATNTVIGNPIPVGTNPGGIVIKPDGTRVYVVNSSNLTVSVIDTASETVIATIPVGTVTPLYSIAITPDGKKVYVTDRGGDSVSVIDTATNTVIVITETVGSEPYTISIAPDQAPLAKFNAILSPAGYPSSFDASDSGSPVGTIANYFWDFGDGSTLSTSSAIAEHTYVDPGTYIVTLTVTNTAGTSTQQVFGMIANYAQNQSIPNVILNGGPTAITSQLITVSRAVSNLVCPPEDVRGKQYIFGRGRAKNVITWEAPKKCGSEQPIAYRIYRDPALTDLVATIRGCPRKEHYKFKERVFKHHKMTYYIVSVDRLGNESLAVRVTIGHKHRHRHSSS